MSNRATEKGRALSGHPRSRPDHRCIQEPLHAQAPHRRCHRRHLPPRHGCGDPHRAHRPCRGPRQHPRRRPQLRLQRRRLRRRTRRSPRRDRRRAAGRRPRHRPVRLVPRHRHQPRRCVQPEHRRRTGRRRDRRRLRQGGRHRRPRRRRLRRRDRRRPRRGHRHHRRRRWCRDPLGLPEGARRLPQPVARQSARPRGRRPLRLGVRRCPLHRRVSGRPADRARPPERGVAPVRLHPAAGRGRPPEPGRPADAGRPALPDGRRRPAARHRREVRHHR